MTGAILAGVAGWGFTGCMITFAIMSMRPVDHQFTRVQHMLLFFVGFGIATVVLGAAWMYMAWAVSV